MVTDIIKNVATAEPKLTNNNSISEERRPPTDLIKLRCDLMYL